MRLRNSKFIVMEKVRRDSTISLKFLSVYLIVVGIKFQADYNFIFTMEDGTEVDEDTYDLFPGTPLVMQRKHFTDTLNDT